MNKCDRCEMDEYSLDDGTGCVSCANSAECPCLLGDKCFTKSACYNIGGTGYGCDGCPYGFEGDGVICSDIDEVSVFYLFSINPF